MSDVVSDTTAEVQNEEALKIGIFHADADVPTASRIQDNIRRAGYVVDLCEFHDAGNPTMRIIDKFTLSHHLVLWMATNASLGDKNILEHAHYIAQHAANCTTGMPLRFAVLEPREGFTATLPPSLAAYTPLIEGDKFERSLKTTMQSIRKKMDSAATQRQGQPSSATGNAVTDIQDVMPRQLPPGSDVGAEVLQFDGPGELPLKARPESQAVRPQQDDSTSENAVRGAQSREITNIIIQGNINTLQFGGGTVNMKNEASQAPANGRQDGGRNQAPSDGTPV